ncbi:succinate dehydrogenase, cytochrome b556 subunit [Plastoroseomonas arctica]|uniref:Succinate dehydrogenase cytochrome b556 subunit n=1 Tax=Plastoroseomonas arctica TaxID=1509237 RepID=A0AAF1KP24_9PROT|nr:succinate dehydrogenase, cytochrome b556 subunit [Plastoroseomonas arctica]MBR0655348.1 succinate dehydrogenase, cytochrome b556 subunit [Plastoroseomonas arctica]
MSHSEDGPDATFIGSRTDGTPVVRPLSPHLQVYDMLQMTSSLSILNRATGIAWSVGLIFLVWWLAALAGGPASFASVQWFLGSVIGWVVLAGLIVVAWFHTLAGIRHLVWDAGYGFDMPNTYRSGRMVIAGTAGLSVLTLIILIGAWI